MSRRILFPALSLAALAAPVLSQDLVALTSANQLVPLRAGSSVIPHTNRAIPQTAITAPAASPLLSRITPEPSRKRKNPITRKVLPSCMIARLQEALHVQGAMRRT